MALANASANNQRRDPDVIIYNSETLYLIDRRFSTTTYGDQNIIIKLLFPNDNTETGVHELNISAEQEVAFQRRAADNNLGPVIYANGLYIPGSRLPFVSYIETGELTNTGDNERIEYRYTQPFYYIIMEYYSQETGWKGPVFVSDVSLKHGMDNNKLFYDFIKKLVINAHVANIFDPIMHFYYHQSHGLRMIDYGRCITCQSPEEQKKCIDDMCTLVQVRQPPSPTTRRSPSSTRRSPTIRRSPTTRRRTSTRRHKPSRSPLRQSQRRSQSRSPHKP